LTLSGNGHRLDSPFTALAPDTWEVRIGRGLGWPEGAALGWSAPGVAALKLSKTTGSMSAPSAAATWRDAVRRPPQLTGNSAKCTSVGDSGGRRWRGRPRRHPTVAGEKSLQKTPRFDRDE
jgi:hypothetical protein